LASPRTNRWGEGVARVRDPDGRLVYLGLRREATVRSGPAGGAA
jgi:hypothetical protein